MIGEWLYGIRPPKYLRYLFFISYSFYRRFTSERGEAHFTAILFLAMMHLLAYEGLFFLLTISFKKINAIFIMLFVGIQFYFWFWHKKKWKLYIEEFKYINRKQQLLGGVYLFIYLFICLLPIAIPLGLSLIYNINLYKKIEELML